MTRREPVRLEPIVYGEYCRECEALGRQTKYDDDTGRDEEYNDIFIPARVYNVVGVGGTGKSFFFNSLIWKLLHNRYIEYHCIVNWGFDRVVERYEREIVVGEKRTLNVFHDMERIEPSAVHPRVYQVRTLYEALVVAGRLLESLLDNPRSIRICLFIDEAPTTALIGGQATKGKGGGVAGTQAEMMSMVTVSRKLKMLLFTAGWDEVLLGRKFRSGIDSTDEGTVPDMVRAIFSKGADIIQQIAQGYWPSRRETKQGRRRLSAGPYRLERPLQEYVAFIPNAAADQMEPSIVYVPPTPLCKRLEDAYPGDTTYSSESLGGMDMGKLPSGKRLNFTGLINHIEEFERTSPGGVGSVAGRKGREMLRYLQADRESLIDEVEVKDETDDDHAEAAQAEGEPEEELLDRMTDDAIDGEAPRPPSPEREDEAEATRLAKGGFDPQKLNDTMTFLRGVRGKRMTKKRVCDALRIDFKTLAKYLAHIEQQGGSEDLRPYPWEAGSK